MSDFEASRKEEKFDTQQMQKSTGRRTIMIVDDDEAALAEMIEGLREQGFFVLSSSNAIAALETAACVKPDAVIMDFKMPNMNGLDAVTAMRRFLTDTQYIMISGHELFCQLVDKETTKTYAILQKPVAMEQIIHTVENALSGK